MNADAVAKGAAWLDANHLGWVDSIDLLVLKMTHERKCILGQLFDGYGDGLAALGKNGDWARAHGFLGDLAGEGCTILTAALQPFWEAEIAKRRQVNVRE
jgi:hypothetical protein